MIETKLYVFSSNRAINNFYFQFEGGFAPKAMSAREFFDACIVIKNKKKAPKFVLKFLLLQTLYEYKNTHKLLLFDKSFVAYLEGMDFLEKFFTELDLNQKSIEEISIVDTYEDYGEHLRILDDIYKSYKNKLSQYGFYGNFYGEDYAICKEIFDVFESIEFHLDGVLSRIEQDILLEIAKEKKIVLSFDCDHYNKRFFDFLNLALKENMHYRIDLQTNEILESKEILKSIDIEAFGFVSRIEQVSFALQKAQDWLSEGRENVALITPSEDFAKYLRVFDSHRNFNYAMGMDIKQTAYYREFVKQEVASDILAMQEILENILEKTPNFKEEIILFNQEFFAGLCAIESVINTFSMEDVRDFYLKELEQIKLSDNRGGKIPVYGMLETRGMSFDAIVIVDFNEEKIFDFNDSDMFLNTKIRKAMEMPTLLDRQNLQKHYYHQLIKNTKEVAVTYVEDSKLQMFHFLEKVGNVVFKKFNRTIFSFNQTKEYKEDEFIGFVPKDFIFSASSLRDFFDCKRRFYFKYLKQVKTEGGAFETQNSLHHILDSVYTEYKNNFDIFQIKKEFETRVRKEMIKNNMEGLKLEVLLNSMRGFWELEKIHYQEYQLVGTECDFNAQIFGKKFRGKIDRIDKKGEAYCVVDYKFGKNVEIKKPSENLSDFQLTLYALALESSGKSVEKCMLYHMQEAKQLHEEFLSEKKDILQYKMAELDKEIEFRKCEDISHCAYCDFKILCNRG